MQLITSDIDGHRLKPTPQVAAPLVAMQEK